MPDTPIPAEVLAEAERWAEREVDAAFTNLYRVALHTAYLAGWRAGRETGATQERQACGLIADQDLEIAKRFGRPLNEHDANGRVQTCLRIALAIRARSTPPA